MSSAYNHAVFLMRPETIAHRNDLWTRHAIGRTWRSPEQNALTHQPCSVRCSKPAEFFITYNYISGKAGRVTDARKEVCREHAAKFARQHCVADIVMAFRNTPVTLPFAPWDRQ